MSEIRTIKLTHVSSYSMPAYDMPLHVVANYITSVETGDVGGTFVCVAYAKCYPVRESAEQVLALMRPYGGM